MAPRINNMPDVPELGFGGAMFEIWHVLRYAAYHLAYVRVYQQTVALRIHPDERQNIDQRLLDLLEVDVAICRAHLTSFFWQLDHFFEALGIAVIRGQKEHPKEKYFWSWKTRLREIKKAALRGEINAYRNKGHEIPGLIGCDWDENEKFKRHVLPAIANYEAKDTIDLDTRLQQYFEYAADVWLSFAPSDFKVKFPCSYTFPVTIPHTYVGELPATLQGLPQLAFTIVAYDPDVEAQPG